MVKAPGSHSKLQIGSERGREGGHQNRQTDRPPQLARDMNIWATSSLYPIYPIMALLLLGFLQSSYKAYNNPQTIVDCIKGCKNLDYSVVSLKVMDLTEFVSFIKFRRSVDTSLFQGKVYRHTMPLWTEYIWVGKPPSDLKDENGGPNAFNTGN